MLRLIGGVIAGAILLLFIPIHYSLWDKFPAWYHLAFLTSLPLLSWLGSRFVQPSAGAA